MRIVKHDAGHVRLKGAGQEVGRVQQALAQLTIDIFIQGWDEAKWATQQELTKAPCLIPILESLQYTDTVTHTTHTHRPLQQLWWQASSLARGLGMPSHLHCARRRRAVRTSTQSGMTW